MLHRNVARRKEKAMFLLPVWWGREQNERKLEKKINRIPFFIHFVSFSSCQGNGMFFIKQKIVLFILSTWKA